MSCGSAPDPVQSRERPPNHGADRDRATERDLDRGPAVTPSQGEAHRESRLPPPYPRPCEERREPVSSPHVTDHPIASFWHPARDGGLRPGRGFSASDSGCRARGRSATDAIGWSGAVRLSRQKGGLRGTPIDIGTGLGTRRPCGAAAASAMRLALARRERHAEIPAASSSMRTSLSDPPGSQHIPDRTLRRASFPAPSARLLR
jgi:hypothetical protein